MTRTFTITAEWSPDPGIWVAGSDDLPGLCIEARTWSEMIEIAEDAAPDLLQGNLGIDPASTPVDLQFVVRQVVALKVA